MKYVFTILMALMQICAFAQLRFYRQLPELALSPHYKVEIKQGAGTYQEIYTYQIVPNATINPTKNDQVANFGFNPAGGAVSIRVSRVDGVALTSTNSRLMNKTYADVSSAIEGGALVMTCPNVKKHLYVKVDGKAEYPLLIFVDPYADTPIPATAKVVTFAARNTPYVQTAQYDRYTIANDVDAVVIEDGAMLKGTLHTASGRTKPLLVTGRGMVMGNGGILHGSTNIPYNAVVLTKGNGHTIENIMIVNSRHFTLDVGASGTIDNVKMLGYDTNNDGIIAHENSKIRNVFSKVNDDHIKLYTDFVTVDNCTFWMQTNGGLFQLAWNSIEPGNNCTVNNCEVLAWEAGCGDPKLDQGGVARTVVNLRSSDALPNSKNLVFKNIYIQGQVDRFIGINGKYQGSNSVTLTGIVMENITLEKKPAKYSWIYTGDSPFKVEFTFKNVKFAGQCLTATSYQINTEGNVVLNYQGCGTAINQSPTVSFTSPAVGTAFTAPATINLSANAADADGSIAKVEFYNGTTLLNSDNTSPYSYSWTGVAAGTYNITAKAFDNAGATSISTAVSVTVDAAIPDIANLTATALDCKSVKLSWSDVAGDEGYRVSRKTAATAFAKLVDIAANAAFYTDNTVAENTTYTYKVEPLQNGAVAATSNQATAAVVTCPPNTCTPWSDPNGIWQGIGRIAISSDGNEHDHDDWAATPFSLALLAAKGLQDKLVLYTFSDHIWGSNNDHPVGANTTAVGAKAEMRISALDGKTQFGFSKTRFIEAVAQPDSAYAALTEQINKSTATDPLIIIAAGPMQVVGTAINDADATKLKYVTIISHSLWNDKHADNAETWENHSGWTWAEIESTFKPKGLKVLHIIDQNGGTGYDGMRAAQAKFDWIKTSAARNNALYKAGSWVWLYTRQQTCIKAGEFDPSDAGMIIYMLTGNEKTNPSDAQAIMEAPVAPCGGQVVTNLLPTVSLTSPAAAAIFTAPATITISATAADADGSIAKVEFYNGTALLNSDNTAPYSYSWTGVVAGTYSITAKAFDDKGATTTSAAVSVTVSNPAPTDIADLKAMVLDCKSVKLTWSDVAGEDGYRVRRKLPTEATYIVLGDIAANATSFTDVTATENTSYNYMVRPLVAGVAVNISNVVNATTTTCPPVFVTQTIELNKGWNLISINLRPTDSSIATLFNGLDVIEIKNFNTFWRAGQNPAFNSLNEISAGQGYLVNMNVAETMTVMGVPVEARLIASQQQTGWQLVGCPFQASTPMAGVFGSNFSVVKNFEGFWIPNGTTNSLENLESGKAYFIYKK